MIKTVLTLIFILLFCTHLFAQTLVDSNHTASPVRTLTYEQYHAYLAGDALGELDLVAVLNNFPLPGPVLKLKKEMGLSAEQLTKLNEINTHLHRLRVQVGESVVSNEKMLDSLFRTNKIDEGSLIFFTNRYGLYQGEIRTALLEACYATRKLLTGTQLARFAALQKAH